MLVQTQLLRITENGGIGILTSHLNIISIILSEYDREKALNKMRNHFKNRLLRVSLIIIILFLTILPFLHTKSEVIITPNPVIVKEEPLSNKDLLWKIGKEKGLNQQTLIQIERVITCESSWNPASIGDFNHSFGLVQIHIPSNPSITKEQALDPTFALNFITDKFIQGHQKMWSCYRILYPQN